MIYDNMQYIVKEICIIVWNTAPQRIEECTIGLDNYVCIVEVQNRKYAVRCNSNPDAYQKTISLMPELEKLGIPVPEIIANGHFQG